MSSNKYSNCKIVWFHEKLDSFRTEEIIPPVYVRIKPTNRCCHNCYFCVYNKKNSNMHDTMNRIDQLSFEKLIEVLDDLKSMGVKAVTYSGGGEPLMHPQINEVLKRTLQNGLDLSILTNGQLLDGERAKILGKGKWVRLSMDYCTAKQFVESRGGSEKMFEKIMINVENFVRIKNSDCDLSVNFIITKKNYKNIMHATTMLHELKIDNVRFSPVWTTNFVRYHKPLISTVEYQLKKARAYYESNVFKIYDSYNITHDIINRKYGKCYIMQTIPVVAADSNIYNCHNKSYTKDGCIGSIKNQSFKELWFSKRTRRHFSDFNPKMYCQCQCANDKKNIFIHELINAYGDAFV